MGCFNDIKPDTGFDLSTNKQIDHYFPGLTYETNQLYDPSHLREAMEVLRYRSDTSDSRALITSYFVDVLGRHNFIEYGHLEIENPK